MTRGRAATPDPFDLGAVAGSDELVEALSTRRLADLSTDSEDPAAALLAALVADVDAGAPPLSHPLRVTRGTQSARRRGVRVVVTLGVTALVLTSAGAAAAGGGNDVSAMRTTHGPVRSRGVKRSNENVQRHTPAPVPVLTGRGPERHAGDKRHAGPPTGDAARATEEQPRGRRSHRSSRGDSGPPADIEHHSPSPTPSSSSQTPTPSPDYVPLAQ